MKSYLKTVFISSVFLTSNIASAKYFAEPHAGFIASGSGSSPSSASYTGPAYGLKLGYYQKEFGFNYGLDFTRSTYTFSTKEVASVAYSRNDIGLFIGYNSQNKYRLWGGIGYTNTSLNDADSYSGHVWEFGVGYAVAPKVSLNVYYKLPTYTSANIGGNSQSLTPAESMSEIILGVSFPLEL